MSMKQFLHAEKYKMLPLRELPNNFLIGNRTLHCARPWGYFSDLIIAVYDVYVSSMF